MSPERKQQIEEFLFREARLLDERCYEAWVALFDDQGTYWVPADETESPNAGVALIYDDKRRLQERLIRMGSSRFWAGQPPTRTCRVLGNFLVDEEPDGIVVECRMIMTLQRRQEHGLLSGVCSYRLRPAGEGFQILEKVVKLLERDQHFDNLTFLI